VKSPVHVVYGGAHLFNAGTAKKLGQLALRALDEHYSEEVFGVSADVIARVRKKLETRPVEDLRIDFEDGFGIRGDEEEDTHAERTAKELPAERDYQCGIRIKSGDRGKRTLAKFLEAGGQPDVVTLPKVTTVSEVEALVRQLDSSIGIELMIEDVRALFSLAELVDACSGRCVAVHLGTYDLTASAGIIAPHQKPDHPLVDFARNMMLVALAGKVRLSDGATTTLPIGDRATVQRAWRMHFNDVRRHMSLGLYQGWDLHPAQLVSRFAAVFSFYREALPEMQARMRAFREAEQRASRVGEVFDDAATGRGLTEFLTRGLACGALDANEAVTSPTQSPAQ
jgi:citrate lyase beta subunit